MITYENEICGKVLLALGLGAEEIDNAKKVFDENPQLSEILANPKFSFKEKTAVINRIFTEGIGNYLKVMTEFGYIGSINGIFCAYDKLVLEKKNIVEAQLLCTKIPDSNTLERFRQMIINKYGATECILNTVEDNSLIGGYRLCINGVEYDRSVSGTIKAMQNKLMRGEKREYR